MGAGSLMGRAFDQLLQTPGAVVIYDGQCPFCDAYIKMLRLRESVGDVTMIDARAEPDLVRECEQRAYALNDGMLVLLAGRAYFGADAVVLLSQLTTASGMLNRAVAAVLKNKALASICYPIMRGGRAITLSMMGRQRL